MEGGLKSPPLAIGSIHGGLPMRAVIASVLVAISVFVSYSFVVSPEPVRAGPPAEALPAPTAMSTVKVIISPSGHGSGVHIGGGMILTAQHVVVGKSEVVIKRSDGGTQTAEVLWASETYDVALIRANGWDGLGVSPLTCRSPIVGEQVTVVGNPQDSEFVTTWGRVSTGIAKRKRWESAFVTDTTTLGGNSGGPVLDASGRVLGLLVGGYPPVGLDFVVSAPAICALLARTE